MTLGNDAHPAGDSSGKEVLALQRKDLSLMPSTGVKDLGVAVHVYNPSQR